MAKELSFLEFIDEHLNFFDETVAASGMPLPDRPMKAASFICEFVDEIDKEGEIKKFDLSIDAHQEIFFYIFRKVNRWYAQRYGDAFLSFSRKVIKGMVLIWGIFFLMEVPLSFTRPGKPGKTYWLHYPNIVHANENPMKWLISPPNLSNIPSNELEKVEHNCGALATKLRCISNKIIAISPRDNTFNSLIANVSKHIESAATNLFVGPHFSNNLSVYWDVQMAIECAFKALSQQKNGTFQKTHDLPTLYGACKASLPGLEESTVAQIPGWKEMIKYRYGMGKTFDVFSYNRVYRAMLNIVDEAVTPMIAIVLKDAAFELRY